MVAKGKVKTEEEIIYFVPEWQRVASFLEERTLSGFIAAFIEAHKILDFYLKRKGYPGDNFDQRFNFAKEKLSNPDKFFWAKKLFDDLVSKPKFNTTTLDLEDAILAYKQALIDILGEDKKALSFSEKMLLLYHFYAPRKIPQIKRLGIYFLVFLFLVLFLADTEPGNLIVRGIVDFAHFVFSYLLAILLFLGGLVILVFLIVFYLEKRKQKQN